MNVQKIVLKPWKVILSLLAVLAISPRADASSLYAAMSGNYGEENKMFLLDPASGSAYFFFGSLKDASNVNYGVTGLAFHPDSNVLYGSTGFSNTPGTEAKLVTINTRTIEVTVIGAFNVGNPGQPATMSDIAFDSAGNLYGVGSNGGPHLYSIDIATGQATSIGDSGLTSTEGGGLAISPAGVFYGTPTANSFGTYDPATGAFMHIANPHKPVGGWYGALAFDDSQLYGINTKGIENPPGTHLVTIDPTNGAVADLGTSRNSVDSIAFGPAIVPEAASWVLALIGIAGLIGWRPNGHLYLTCKNPQCRAELETAHQAREG